MQSITIASTYYHMQFDTFLLIVAWFWGYLQRVTMRYRQIFLKMYINIFFLKLTVMHGNPLQITQN